MNNQALINICTIKNINQATIAKMAHVSRAAVTRWFKNVQKDGWINIETNTLRLLAKNLGVPCAQLLKETPELSPIKTLFIWDNLFPDMESFLKALSIFDLKAVARLVQVKGFYDAKILLGKKIITQFKAYKHFIKPVRRKELESIWNLYL